MSEVEKRIGELADKINAEHCAFVGTFRKAVEHGIRCGELLAQAKEQCPHGTWLQCLEANFDGSARTAQVYMQLYNRRDELRAKTQHSAHLSIDGALRELAVPLSNIPRRERVILERARELVDAGYHVSELSPNMEGLERDSDEKRRGFVALTAHTAMLCSALEYRLARLPLSETLGDDPNGITPELLVEVTPKMQEAADATRWWVGECEWIEAQVCACDWPPGRGMPKAAFARHRKHMLLPELYVDDDEYVRWWYDDEAEYPGEEDGYGLPSPRASVNARCGTPLA